tara:strand:- start:297 stop:425 length:129 start_codon:yes stop_codon:yes gene_type:complete
MKNGLAILSSKDLEVELNVYLGGGRGKNRTYDTYLFRVLLYY